MVVVEAKDSVCSLSAADQIIEGRKQRDPRLPIMVID